MERQCYAYFAKIDELGGMVEAVKRNYPQREIADAAFDLQQRIDKRDFIQVGVNDFCEGDDGEIEILRIDPELERKQLGRLQAVRARRDSGAVEDALKDIREAAAREGDNLLPHFVRAAEVHASEGEIVAALQDVWGSYRETPVF
jgi:methylmalonyl-CoA mutase N-terminal domain/subunit